MSTARRGTIEVGQAIPSARVSVQTETGWQSVDARTLFAGRNVVLFALPGAFTPTCSSSHLPGYEALAPAFSAAGIDAIYCLSVNDPFVMEAWGREQRIERVALVADGNAAWTRAVGMDVSKEDLCFGVRSWRYAMVVRDGVVAALFVEPDVPGDPFEVSDAETVLRSLAPDAKLAPPVTIFTRPGCPHCRRAKGLLDGRGWTYDEIEIGREATTRTLAAVAGATTVPRSSSAGGSSGARTRSRPSSRRADAGRSREEDSRKRPPSAVGRARRRAARRKAEETRLRGAEHWSSRQTRMRGFRPIRASP
jgi:peroxiredoxin/glutaredoxin